MALITADDWSSAAVAAADAPLGDDERWTMGTSLSLGKVCPPRRCQETCRTGISSVRRESVTTSQKVGLTETTTGKHSESAVMSECKRRL